MCVVWETWMGTRVTLAWQTHAGYGLFRAYARGHTVFIIAIV